MDSSSLDNINWPLPPEKMNAKNSRGVGTNQSLARVVHK